MDGPQKIARYHLTGELGRGGMGVVYRGHDPQLDRPVAVKVILFPPGSSQEVRAQLEQRFEGEARAAAGIVHPGVITVHDFGRDGEYLYLVMELVDGESLADRLERGARPSRAEALSIVARVAEALAVAHDRGVVHRDVTPRNILMAKDGRVIVTDFGIARSLGERTTELTQTGAIVGSPSYMAPELIRSQPFDGRADVFALGVVLHLMLTGQRLFDASDMTSLLYQIVHEDPFEREDVRRDLDPPCLDLVRRCVEKMPAKRFATARDLASAARRVERSVDYLENRESTAVTGDFEDPEHQETIALGRNRPRTHRRRSSKVLTVGAALATGLMLVIGWFGFWNVQDSVPVAETSSSSASEFPIADPSASPRPLRSAPPGAASRVGEGETEHEPDPESVPSTQISTSASELLPEATGQETEQPSPDPFQNSAPRNSVAGADTGPEGGTERVELLPALELPNALQHDRKTEMIDEPTHVAADTTPPIVSIYDIPPAADGAEISLSGRALDDAGTVRLEVAGVVVPVAEDGSFETRYAVDNGRMFTIVAIDQSGNRTSNSIEVANVLSRGASGTLPSLRDPKRFRDLGDFTLLDSEAGIMWAAAVSPDELNLKGAKRYCRQLSLAAHKDWVLPKIDELKALSVNTQRELAAGHSSIQVPDVVVWSSSKKGFGEAWNFDFGSSTEQLASASEGSAKVLCNRRNQVRTPEPFGPTPGELIPTTLGSTPGGQLPPPPRGGGGGGNGGGGGGNGGGGGGNGGGGGGNGGGGNGGGGGGGEE